ETSLQILDLFFDLLAALLSVKEDIVGIAILLFQFVVQVAEAGCVLLLQVLQGVDQLVVGLSAGVFQRDSVSVEKLLTKQAKMVQTFKTQKCGLKTTVQGLQSFVSVDFCGAELPIAEWWDPVNDSHVASFVGDMVRAALVLMHRREPVCLRFGPLLSSLLFLVAGFPAVGDFGQEFADALDVIAGPCVNLFLAYRDGLLRRHSFSQAYISTEGDTCDAELLCRFARGVGLHLVSMIPIDKRVVKEILSDARTKTNGSRVGGLGRHKELLDSVLPAPALKGASRSKQFQQRCLIGLAMLGYIAAAEERSA